jgi:hypothetical protein
VAYSAGVQVTGVRSESSHLEDLPPERITLHYQGIRSIYAQILSNQGLLTGALSWCVIPGNYGVNEA